MLFKEKGNHLGLPTSTHTSNDKYLSILFWIGDEMLYHDLPLIITRNVVRRQGWHCFGRMFDPRSTTYLLVSEVT
jgi:hypothetical protein